MGILRHDIKICNSRLHVKNKLVGQVSESGFKHSADYPNHCYEAIVNCNFANISPYCLHKHCYIYITLIVPNLLLCLKQLNYVVTLLQQH